MERLDFNKIADEVGELSCTAKATFLHRIIQRLTPGVLRTVIRYCYTRLDECNEALPDGDPQKELWKNRRKAI